MRRESNSNGSSFSWRNEASAHKETHLQLPDSTQAFPGCHSLPKGPQGASVLEQTKLAASVANVTGRRAVGIYHI